MSKAVGVVMTNRVIAGLIEDHRLQGGLREFPENIDDINGLIEVPAENLCEIICDAVATLMPSGSTVDAVGVAMPGYLHQGVMLDSPNLPQLKGAQICSTIRAGLQKRGLDVKLAAFNDADAVAAGIAARGETPMLHAAASNTGHMVVTLDPKENYCGCGGKGHLEGIMGYRAMRLRFLDMEPDEVFAAAKKGDRRCAEFVELWHRALAAATASMIHLEGPGRFYYTGRDIQRLELPRLKQHLWEAIKMSPLQNYTAEMLPEDPSLAVIGAGVAALIESKC